MKIEEKLVWMKDKIEILSKKRERAIWEKEQVEKEAGEMGVKSPADARKKAKKAHTEAEALAKELTKMMEETQAKYKDLLELATK